MSCHSKRELQARKNVYSKTNDAKLEVTDDGISNWFEEEKKRKFNEMNSASNSRLTLWNLVLISNCLRVIPARCVDVAHRIKSCQLIITLVTSHGNRKKHGALDTVLPNRQQESTAKLPRRRKQRRRY